MNPASWMLDVIGTTQRTNPSDGCASAPSFDYAAVYSASALCLVQQAALKELSAQDASAGQLKQLNLADYAHPLTTQVRWLVGRGFRSYWRDSQMNFGRCVMIVAIALIFGLVFIQLDATSYSSLTSKVSAVFSITGFIAILSTQTTLPNIFNERAVFYRERASNSYPSWVYSTTTALCEIPFVFFSSLLGVGIFYWLVGYQSDAALFFQFWCTISAIVLIQSSFGQLSAALLPNFVAAIQLAGSIDVLFFLFGGVSQPADTAAMGRWRTVDERRRKLRARAGRSMHSAHTQPFLPCPFSLSTFSCSFVLQTFLLDGNGTPQQASAGGCSASPSLACSLRWSFPSVCVVSVCRFYWIDPIPKAIIAIVLPQFECHLPNPYELASGCPSIRDPTTGAPVTIHRYVQDQWNTSYDDAFARMMGWLAITYMAFRIGIHCAFRFMYEPPASAGIRRGQCSAACITRSLLWLSSLCLSLCSNHLQR